MHYSHFLSCVSVLVIAVAGPIPTSLEQNEISIRGVDSKVGLRLSVRAQEVNPGTMDAVHAKGLYPDGNGATDNGVTDTGLNGNGANGNGANGNGANSDGGNYDGGNYDGGNGVVNPVPSAETDFNNIQPGQFPQDPDSVTTTVVIKDETYTYPNGKLNAKLRAQGVINTPELKKALDHLIGLLGQQVKEKLTGRQSSEGNGNDAIETKEEFINANEEQQKKLVWAVAVAILGEGFAVWIIANWAVVLPALVVVL